MCITHYVRPGDDTFSRVIDTNVLNCACLITKPIKTFNIRIYKNSFFLKKMAHFALCLLTIGLGTPIIMYNLWLETH